MVGEKVTLFWLQEHKYAIKIPLGWSGNIMTFNLSPDLTRYTAFCAAAVFNPSNELEDPIIATPAQTVSDDDNSMAGDKDRIRVGPARARTWQPTIWDQL
jgi:hypothetical protein